jgi:hypothetical protein
MSAPTSDIPTLADHLDQVTARLDRLCAAELATDGPLYELWRASAELAAALRLIAHCPCRTDCGNGSKPPF